MINIFVLVTILGHLPVILSAKSKGSENMEQILIVEDDSFLNKMLVIIPRLFEPPVRILRATLPDGGSHCKLLVLLNADYSMRYLL